MRIILITLLNLAFPFLIWIAKMAYAEWRYNRWLKWHDASTNIKDITPKAKPSRHFPVRKLLLAGLILLACSLIGYRLFGVQQDTSWTTGNAAKSAEVWRGE